MKNAPQQPKNNEGIPIEVVTITPGLTLGRFEHITEDEDILILITYATGVFPDELVPIVQKRISEGAAVISLTDNVGDSTGFRGVRYAAGAGAYEAGMRGLEKVNAKDLSLVYDTTIKAYENGLRGQALADYIAEHFSFKDGEEFPPPKWDTEEGLEALRSANRNALSRLGYTGDELKQEMSRWEKGMQGSEGQV